MTLDQKKHILLAEDNEFNQELIVDILSESGFSVFVANNGQEVLNLLEQHADDFFHLILMDLEMPIMDGHQATIKIRQARKYQDLPIVALTAHEEVETKELCLVNGMQDFLIKPIDPDVLIQTIHRWLNLTKQPGITTNIATTDTFPQFQHIDTVAGLHFTANNRALFIQLLQRFASSQSVSLKQIEKAQTVSEVDSDFLRLIHTLKGVSATIGASKITALSTQVEANLTKDRAQIYTETSQLLQQLADELRSTLEELNVFVKQTSTLNNQHQQSDPNTNLSTQSDVKQLLKDLLQDNSPDALSFFEMHQQYFATIFNNHKYIEFQNAIENYDFDLAHSLLNLN